MADERFAEHLEAPFRRGVAPDGAFDGHAGGSLCGDLVRISVRVRGERVDAAGFGAEGCGALTAAASAVCLLAEGATILEVARIDTPAIAAELGGLSPGKLHAADLVGDAFHRALGAAVAADAEAVVGASAEGARISRSGPAYPQEGARDRTLVAMSGGVDSAVAALLVQRAGDDVVAVTLELWADPENDAAASCCSADAVRRARQVAHGLGLPHLTLDLREQFRAGVVEPFLQTHARGETPNPCVGCNGHVRLDAMLDLATRLGASRLATGHYARTTPDSLLRAAKDPAKDQTYMLAALSRRSLARMRFPLGELTKPEVRVIAREAGLPVAETADSMDLCFLAGTGKAAFLARHGDLEDDPGDVVDATGKVLAHHRGHHHFTVGQRKGLGVAAGEPLYVLRTEPRANRVVVGPRDQLATTRVAVRGARLHEPGATVDRVKLRYRSRPIACTVAGSPPAGVHRALTLELHDPVEGAAPGQAACLLRGDVVVGWGTISRA